MIDDGYTEKTQWKVWIKSQTFHCIFIVDSEIKEFINIRILKEHRRCEQSVYLQYQK